jgi:iron complex outermembrane receptor protein
LEERTERVAHRRASDRIKVDLNEEREDIMRHIDHPMGTARRVLLASTGMFALISAPVFAQAARIDAAPPVAAAAQATDTSDVNAVDEIVVTAQKRAESAQNVPIAITALGTEQLRDAGVADTRTSRPASRAQRHHRDRRHRPAAHPRHRRYRPGPGIENPVAVYVDGVYYSASFGVLQSLFDAEQVAVLKGPQGTLFGRNATGGLIQITTRDPSHDYGPAGRSSAMAITRPTNAAGLFSGGLGDTRGEPGRSIPEPATTAMARTYSPATTSRTAAAGAGRAKLLFEPTMRYEGRAALRRLQRPRRERTRLPPTSPSTRLGQNVPEPDHARSAAIPKRDIYADFDPKMKTRQWGLGLTINHDFGGATLKSITAYRKSTSLMPSIRTAPPPRRMVIDNNSTTSSSPRRSTWSRTGDGPVPMGARRLLHARRPADPPRTTGLLTFGGNGYTDSINDIKLDSLAGFAEGTYTFGREHQPDRRHPLHQRRSRAEAFNQTAIQRRDQRHAIDQRRDNQRRARPSPSRDLASVARSSLLARAAGLCEL